MNSQPKSIFILGTAYSGSSVLGQALNSKKNSVAYVGELSRAPKFVTEYKLDVHTGQCSACQINNIECPLYSTKLLAKLGDMSPAQAHIYLAKYLGVQSIVDTSKHPAWLRLFLPDILSTSARVLLTVKNPKNYVQSCLDRGIGEPWQSANAWRDTYADSFRTLNRYNIPYFVVRNEDFLANRQATLENIGSFLGIKAHKLPNAKSSTTIHAIGGNPAMRADEFGNKRVLAVAKQLGRAAFDLNPSKKSADAKQKISYDTQILFDTPGLSDLANLLGYNAKDIIL